MSHRALPRRLVTPTDTDEFVATPRNVWEWAGGLCHDREFILCEGVRRRLRHGAQRGSNRSDCKNSIVNKLMAAFGFQAAGKY